MQKVEIYYLRRDYIELMLSTAEISKENIEKTHIKMPSPSEKIANLINIPEDAFKIYNGASETPNPFSTIENQLFIKNNQSHTSMTVGDIIVINNVMYLCENLGWREIGREI